MIPRKALPEYGPLLLSAAAAPAFCWFLLFTYGVGDAVGGATEMMAALAAGLLMALAAVLLGFIPALVIAAPLLGLAGWLVPARWAGFGYAAAGAAAGGAYSLTAWLMSQQYPLGGSEEPPDVWLGTYVVSSSLYAARTGSSNVPPEWYLLAIAPMAGLLAGLLYWSRLRR